MIDTSDDDGISVYVAQHGFAANAVNVFGAPGYSVDELRLVLQAAVHIDVNECVCQDLIERANILGDLRLVPQLLEREHFGCGAIIVWFGRFGGPRQRQSKEEQGEQRCYFGSQLHPETATASRKFHLSSRGTMLYCAGVYIGETDCLVDDKWRRQVSDSTRVRPFGSLGKTR